GDPRRRPPRVARRAVSPATPREAVLDDLELLAGARRYCDWLFAQYAGAVRGRGAEMGAGIGTFSRRTLNAGAAEHRAPQPDTGATAASTPSTGTSGVTTATGSSGSPRRRASKSSISTASTCWACRAGGSADGSRGVDGSGGGRWPRTKRWSRRGDGWKAAG